MHSNLVGYYFNVEQYRLYMSGLIGSAQLSLAQQAVSPVRRPACLPASLLCSFYSVQPPQNPPSERLYICWSKWLP